MVSGSGKAGTRAASFETVTTEHRTARLRLEGHLVVFAAVVTNDLKPGRSVISLDGLFGTAARTPLRRHHVSLIKRLLFLLSEDKDLFALNTRYLYIRHDVTS
jgi:hypothetical protein